MQLQTLKNISHQNSKFLFMEYILLSIVILIAVITAILLPIRITSLIILFLIVCPIIIFTRIHIVHLLILTIILGFSLDPIYRSFFTNLLYILFAFSLIYYFYYLCLVDKLSVKLSSHHFVFVLFLIMGFIALISIFYNARFTNQGVFELARIIAYGPLFMIFYFFLKDESIIRRSIILIVIVSLAFVVYSYWLILTIGIKSFMLFGITSFRVLKTGLGNPNAIASVIGYSLPILLSYMMFGKNRLYKRYAFLCFFFTLVIMILWNSRATYVYFFITSLVLIGFHKKRFKYYTVICIFIIAGFILIAKSSFFQDLLRFERGLSGRSYLWKAAVNIIEQNPILGTGPGSYADIKYYHMDPGIARFTAGLGKMTAHNLILYRSSELGIGAGIIILLYWGFVIYYFLKNKKIVRGQSYYYLYLGCGAIFIGFIFKFIFEGAGNVIPLLFVAIIFKFPGLGKTKPHNIV